MPDGQGESAARRQRASLGVAPHRIAGECCSKGNVYLPLHPQRFPSFFFCFLVFSPPQRTWILFASKFIFDFFVLFDSAVPLSPSLTHDRLVSLAPLPLVPDLLAISPAPTPVAAVVYFCWLLEKRLAISSDSSAGFHRWLEPQMSQLFESSESGDIFHTCKPSQRPPAFPNCERHRHTPLPVGEKLGQRKWDNMTLTLLYCFRLLTDL